jgi:hypothetical protein
MNERRLGSLKFEERLTAGSLLQKAPAGGGSLTQNREKQLGGRERVIVVTSFLQEPATLSYFSF